MKSNNWQKHFDASAAVPYVQLNNQWVGYDDTESVTLKAHYVNKERLAGAMIWSIETDDFHATCGQGNFPLLKAIRSGLDSASTDTGSSTHTTVDPPSPNTDVPSTPTPPSSSTPPTIPSPPNQDNQCTSEGRFRDHDDCTKFIYCAPNGGNYTVTVFDCPPGTVFDQKLGVCNWPANVPECN